jgi:hypothetical protein
VWLDILNPLARVKQWRAKINLFGLDAFNHMVGGQEGVRADRIGSASPAKGFPSPRYSRQIAGDSKSRRYSRSPLSIRFPLPWMHYGSLCGFRPRFFTEEHSIGTLTMNQSLDHCFINRRCHCPSRTEE